jgi:hypothetical protein
MERSLINDWIKSDHRRKVNMITMAYKPVEIDKPIIMKLLKEQIYKKNERETCVYDGLVLFFQNKLIYNPRNEYTKRNLNYLIHNKQTLARPYSDDDLKIICEPLKISIHIINLIDGSVRKYNENSKNRDTVTFFQTKYNHIDLMMTSDEPLEITDEEWTNIVNQYDRPDKFYMIQNNVLYILNNKPVFIDGQNVMIGELQSYKKIRSEFSIASQEWHEQINFKYLSMNTNDDAMKLLEKVDHTMHAFIDPTMKIDNNLYEEVDQKAAYANMLDINVNKLQF